jgi:hypothetical protein
MWEGAKKHFSRISLYIETTWVVFWREPNPFISRPISGDYAFGSRDEILRYHIADRLARVKPQPHGQPWWTLELEFPIIIGV